MDRYEIGTLRAYYGALLTVRQNEMLRLKYDEDLSFGEIAESYSISRQAVLYAVKAGEKALAEFENKLGLAAKLGSLASAIERTSSALADGDVKEAATVIAQAKALLED